MTACTHESFSACIEVHRLGADANAAPSNYMAEVTVRCANCNVPFRFLGPSTGLSFNKPTVNLTATTLHAPIAPGERPLDEMPESIRVEVPS